MNEQLFRKKSIERVSSPEQLNEYIRVSNPGVWMVLTAIVILLVGVCVWGVVGHLDTTLTTVAIGEKGEMTVYVKESDIASVEPGMEVWIGDVEYTVSEIASEPIVVDDAFTDYALHVGELVKGEWVYPVKVSGESSEGVHNAEIVIDSVSPISFIMN
ncbi:MAG: hypothetical protein ACI4A3_10190 [Lachnospiraceae bacterium]